MPSRMASASASSSMMPPRGRVDDADARLGLGQEVASEQAHGLGRLGRVDRHEVSLGDELLDPHQAHTHGPGPLLGHEGVVADELHAEGVGALGNQRTGPAEADHAEDLAVQLDALPFRALPAASDERRMGLGDVASLGEQQRHGLLGHREDVRGRRVHHHDAALGRGRDVHVVQADTGPAHHLERGACGQDLGRDLGGRADDERLGPDDRPEELLGGEPLLDVDVVTRVGKQVEPALRDLLRHQYPCHCGGLLAPPASNVSLTVVPPTAALRFSLALRRRGRPAGTHPRRGRGRTARRTCGSSPARRTLHRGRQPPWLP